MADVCPHEPSVLLILAGESTPDVDEHVAHCVICQSTLAEHAEVLHAAAPLAETQAPAARTRWWPAAAALAAAALLAVAVSWPTPAPPDPASIDVAWDEPADVELDAMNLAFADLTFEEL
jgi:ferric-dicitrate binding protein FerR (iron transport regulator)